MKNNRILEVIDKFEAESSSNIIRFNVWNTNYGIFSFAKANELVDIEVLDRYVNILLSAVVTGINTDVTYDAFTEANDTLRAHLARMR